MMKTPQHIKPEIILGLVGGGLQAVGLFWLLIVFTAYFIFEVIAMDASVLHVPLSRLGVMAAECSMLFVLFVAFGLGLCLGSRAAWRHCLSAAIIWLVLGCFLTALWIFYTPYLNLEMPQHSRISSAAVMDGSTLILMAIITFVVVLPIVVFALLSLPSVKALMKAKQTSGDERSLTELVLLWGFWGSAILTMLGVTFDERLVPLSQGGAVSMTAVWIVLTLYAVLSGSCVLSRKRFYWRVCLAAALLCFTLFVLLLTLQAFKADRWLMFMPDSPFFRTLAFISLGYFCTVCSVFMGLGYYRKSQCGWEREAPLA